MYKKIIAISIVASVVGVSILMIHTAEAASFVVNSTADTADFLIGDGFCDIDDSANDGPCTLRAAIEEANNDAGLDQISFAIAGVGPHTITLGSDLPAIVVGPITIDGSMQSGASCATHTLKISLDLAGFNGFNVEVSSVTIRGLNIYGGAGDAPIVLDSTEAIVECNHIGTNIEGTAIASSPNESFGIFITGSSNQIGGNTVTERNIISGNYCEGIGIVSGGNNIIQGNYIGTDVTGLVSIGNEGGGISVAPTGVITDLTIGGVNTGEGNVISGNGANTHATCTVAGNYGGIAIDNNTGSVTDVTIVGNYIGVDADGSGGLGNALGGIVITDLSNAGTIVIGGDTAGERNIIGSNGTGANDAGISISNTGSGTITTIAGNYIGLDETGLLPRPNMKGINISSSDGVTIGGSVSGEGNIISGNVGDAIVVSGFSSPSYDNYIMGNTIGLDSAGDALGNGGNGVSIALDVHDVVIGGAGTNEGNTIAYNDGIGIQLLEVTPLTLSPTRISILGNELYENADLGIDMSIDTDANFVADSSVGPTINDVGDGDVGPNDLLNFPVIVDTTGSINGITVDYTLDVPAGDYRIEFFNNTIMDVSGNGEGETFISYDEITHTGSGSESFTHTFIPTASVAHVVATATEDIGLGLYGSSSEFSEEVTGIPDTVLPSVAITSTEISPTSADPIPMTATFSEGVLGFTSGDVVITGSATLSNFATVNAYTYTFDIVPTIDETITVDIPAASVTDYSGNDNTSGQFSIDYATPREHRSSGRSVSRRRINFIQTNPPITPVTPPLVCVFDRNIKFGDRGESVRIAQEFLLSQGFSPGRIDGAFGIYTGMAVRAFQKAYPEIYIQSGLSKPTTWFYDQSRAKASALCNAK